MNKTALIIPYFGKWPDWMPLYLYSCSRQKDIDFIFYTDCGVPGRIYGNTIFRPMSFEDYCALASSRLKISFHPKAAYKLCDLRPFYGMVHEEDLSEYEWWGFGDLDLVYGDLSLLVNEENQRKYDLLTTHVDRLAGHFTVIRKKSKYTTLGLEIPNWEKLLCDEAHHAMDEVTFTRKAIPINYLVMRKLYSTVLSRITKKAARFWWLYRLSKLFKLWPTRALMKEMFTTFVPSKEGVCEYDVKTGNITCSTNQMTKMPKWGGQFTCISSSSRRQPIWTPTCIGVTVSTRYPKTMISRKAA